MKLKAILLLLLFTLTYSASSQWLKAKGKVIVNNQDEEVLLRGLGPGGWMVMEGYMMKTEGVAGTQHEIRSKLIELMGVEKTNLFFDKWLANHFTKRDVDSLSAWGFNSIRLPMHYNLFTLPIEAEPVAGNHTWLGKGFEMVDSLLSWCASNEIYLILDLHAAPGGQGYNADISDYDDSKPSLWESKDNQDKTVAFWRKIAERYKNEPWIGGYDLINETNWDLPGGTLLRNLYEEITDSIRATGDRHVLFIEGNWFANDFTGLTPPWDDNMVYSFHKYWSSLDDLDWIIPLREQYDIPLWMGESGENSNTWFTDAVVLFEKHNIGWAWWTMRKMESINSPYSITINPGYQDILDYWKGEGPKPSEDESFNAVMQLAENLLVTNNTYRPDVIDALMRQPTTEETLPYALQSIPGTIYLSDYDLGRNGVAYYDVDAANYQLSSGQWQAWNSGWAYRNDGVDIEANDLFNSNGYHVGFTHTGEWMNYTVNIEQSATYALGLHVASEESGGQFHLSMDGEDITPVTLGNSTGGWMIFDSLTIEDVYLEAGRHVLKYHVDNDIPLNISHITFDITAASNTVPFTAITGTTFEDQKSIMLVLNDKIEGGSLANAASLFSATVNGEMRSINTVFQAENKTRTLILELSGNLMHSDNVKLSYTGSTITSKSEKILSTFTNLSVLNNLPIQFVLPGVIQAEDFINMSGFQTESSTDDGGGFNLGYVNIGDYADYLIYVSQETEFTVKLRVASLSAEGLLGFYSVVDSVESELFTTNTPVTGGWQDWSTIYTNVVMPAGSYTLRLKILGAGEFNLNWFEFAEVITGFSLNSELYFYPNPAKEFIKFYPSEYDYYSIVSMDGSRLMYGEIPENNHLSLKSLKPGLYVIKMMSQTTGKSMNHKFIIAE